MAINMPEKKKGGLSLGGIVAGALTGGAGGAAAAAGQQAMASTPMGRAMELRNKIAALAPEGGPPSPAAPTEMGSSLGALRQRRIQLMG